MTSQFLTYEDALEIHADQIARYGGSAGIRDAGLLRSALAQPETGFGENLLHSSLEAQAAAYLYHLVKNHPFIDGNKRVGTACCLVFLEINGYELDPSLDEIDNSTGHTYLEVIVISVVTNKISKEDLIIFLKNNIRPLSD